VEWAIGVAYLLTFGSLGIGAASLLPPLGTQITECDSSVPVGLEKARAQALEWTASYEAVRSAINTSVMHTIELARKYVTEGLGSVVVQVLGYRSRAMLIRFSPFFRLNHCCPN
jgi:predicted PurR-regulated permease PerM